MIIHVIKTIKTGDQPWLKWLNKVIVCDLSDQTEWCACGHLQVVTIVQGATNNLFTTILLYLYSVHCVIYTLYAVRDNVPMQSANPACTCDTCDSFPVGYPGPPLYLYDVIVSLGGVQVPLCTCIMW